MTTGKSAGKNRYKDHQILVKKILLRLSEAGHFAWANNTGAVKTENRYIRFGLKGSPDILCLTEKGEFVAIEVKTGNAVQNRSQKNFEKAVQKRGGLYIVARSLEDIECLL